MYQLLNYVINELLKKNVEPANISEPGQRKGRHGHCVSIIMQKVPFIQQEARRQGKRVYRVDIDLKNALNAMFQAAFWQMMRIFRIPAPRAGVAQLVRAKECESLGRRSDSV